MDGNTGKDVGVIELHSVAKSAQYTFAGELIYLADWLFVVDQGQ